MLLVIVSKFRGTNEPVMLEGSNLGLFFLLFSLGMHSILLFYLFYIYIYSLIFISWRLIILHIVVAFAIHWHESAMDLHVFPIPIPPPTSLPTPSLWVFPVHQPWALVSCIQPLLVICFTLDNILVSVLFSQNIPPLPSLTESQSLFCTSVSLFLFCI